MKGSESRELIREERTLEGAAEGWDSFLTRSI